MARGKTISARKTAKTTTKKAVNSSKEKNQTKPQSIYQNLFEQLKLGESYVSLVLGALVVIIIFAAGVIFVNSTNSPRSTFIPADQVVPPTESALGERSYTLQEGEGLWDVAVKFYGDGYKWTEIAKANNFDINNSDYIEPGTKLIIPGLK